MGIPPPKYCACSNQKKMTMGEPFHVPEKPPVGTLLTDGAMTLNVRS